MELAFFLTDAPTMRLAIMTLSLLAIMELAFFLTDAPTLRLAIMTLLLPAIMAHVLCPMVAQT
jgi:hypothetical protein